MRSPHLQSNLPRLPGLRNNGPMEGSMATISIDKIIKANRTEWIVPHSTQPRPVLVFPNSGPGHFTSWICEEAAPQRATEEGQIIVCESCHAALAAGAE